MTAGAIVERLYRTYLYPPDMRPAQALLATGINDTDTSIVFGSFAVPEDELLLGVGAQVELGSELCQLTAYDENTTTGTVTRGVGGTTATSHAAGSSITLSPPYPRLSVFEAVADNILTLYPRLYTVTVKAVSPIGGVADIEDDLAVEVIEVWPDDFSTSTTIDARIVDFHQAVGGRALITNIMTGSIWVRYRRRFGSATDEADTLASLGMDERWVNIVMVGAAADIFAGRDLSQSHVDWVGSVLQAENISVGARSQLSRQLAGYRDHLLFQAQKEMRAEYRANTHMRSPTQVVTRNAWG